MRSREPAKRGSAARSGRSIARQKASNSLSLLAPTVNQPSLARSAWYGAASRRAEPRALAARRVGARHAEAGDRAVDEPRIDGAQGLVRHAEPARHARAIVLHEDVGGLHEPADDLHALRALEIHRDAALVAVHGQEGSAVAVLAGGAAAHVLAAGRLHLDDVGAHVGEVHRAERRRHRLRHVDHADAFERLHSTTMGYLLASPSARTTFHAPPWCSRCQSSRYSRELRRMSSSSAWFI